MQTRQGGNKFNSAHFNYGYVLGRFSGYSSERIMSERIIHVCLYLTNIIKKVMQHWELCNVQCLY